jgi:hypothetical protein
MRSTRATAILIGALSVASASCGGDDGAVEAVATTFPAPSTAAAPPTTVQPMTTVAPVSTVAPATTPATSAPPATTAVPPDWRHQAAAVCDHHIAGETPGPDGSPAGFLEWAEANRQLVESQPALDVVNSPIDPAVLADLAAQREMYLTAVEQAAAVNDPAAAFLALDHYLDIRNQTGAVFIMAGASCAGFDASRASGASLNVPLTNHPVHLTVAYDSVWVSADLDNTKVTRIDPVTGEIVAAVDVGSTPIKMQPADGRLWVQTEDAYAAIDPITNTVSARLAWSEVGPGGGNKWAVDGALWICAGQRLHRYDPTTVQRVATIDVGFDCGKVYATVDLVVTSTYNQDPGESGTSVAAFIDPVSNEITATLPLPVDVGSPLVLDDAVFFPGYLGSTAVVVDRGAWTIAATPDLGRPTASAVVAFDGDSIYVPTVDSQTDPVNGRPDVLVVNPSTFAVTGVIETLGANSIAVADGSVWVVDTAFAILQRFDVE